MLTKKLIFRPKDKRKRFSRKNPFKWGNNPEILIFAPVHF